MLRPGTPISFFNRMSAAYADDPEKKYSDLRFILSQLFSVYSKERDA